MNETIGWDIGGVNTKMARIAGGEILAVRSRPYELQRDPHALAPLLRALVGDAGGDAASAHAVTMTAELSQMFRTKRDGVAFVLDAVESAFPSSIVRVYAVDGRFLSVAEARGVPMLVAAANWAATAQAVARHHPDALLIDIGSTSTDIIPIVGGRIAAEGRTDPERLASGELVYTGAVRTPAEAIASHVPLGRTHAGVSAEGFALAGDVHVWRGALAPADYTGSTPDGRPATREFAGERLARVVCGDRELLDETAVSAIADALAVAQLVRISEATGRVLARHRSLRLAVVGGLGAFLGEAAARAAGLDVAPLAALIGDAAARCAPAAAVGVLLEHALIGAVAITPEKGSYSFFSSDHAENRVTPLLRVVDTVVKIGGVLADREHFAAALSAIDAAARRRRLLVVPGGGPFADAVREADRRMGLSDDAAHWMAILAMDQYAHVVVERLRRSVLVHELREMSAALDEGRVPVLAPSRWLRAVDPLPHSWEVTSDSISAWVAGQVGARRLVLVKPAGATTTVTDAHFRQALPAHVTPVVITADHVDQLHEALSR